MCVALRDLFGATYVTLGLVDPDDRRVLRAVTCGTDASCGVGVATWFEIGGAVPGVLSRSSPSAGRCVPAILAAIPPTLRLPPLHPEVRAFLAVPLV